MNQTICLNGANGLLGKAINQYLQDLGYNLILWDLKHDKEAKDTETIMYFEGSITSEADVQESISRGVNKFGSIDALINCAYPRNKNYGNDLESVDYDDFCENLSMSVGGYFLCTKEYAKYFKLQKNLNSIVNIGSIYGTTPPRFDIYENQEFTMPVEYAAIKSSIIQLTKYFSSYYRNKNIRFNTVSPGGIFNNHDQDFLAAYNKHCTNIGMLSPRDVAKTVEFLISDKSNSINGQNIIVDDGFSL